MKNNNHNNIGYIVSLMVIELKWKEYSIQKLNELKYLT